MRFLFWYSGEHPTMPQAEARAVFESHGHTFEVVDERARFQCVETDAMGSEAIDAARRLGLTHDVASYMFSASLDEPELQAAAQDCCLDGTGTFAVRAERVSPDAAWPTPEAERRVGQLLAGTRRVDLQHPDTVVRAFVDADRLWAGRQLWDRDPKETAARHVKHRPVFSPVSLPPKLARALVNLARVPAGGVVYDPFCGTGGILLEAAQMGLQVVGSDLDPDMAEGSGKNLAHFRLEPRDLFAADIADAPAILAARGLPTPDAVVTDLPYGRSASTGKEPLAGLYDRAFAAISRCLRPGSLAVLGVPAEGSVRRAADFLDPVDLFKVRVHRSLTRHFAVMRRRPEPA